MKTLTAETDAEIDIDSDTYIRASDFDRHIGGVHFPTEVWAVFAQCDTPRTPVDIARLTSLDVANVISSLRRLSSKHLIRKNEIDWLTYLASLNSTPVAVEETPAVAHVESPAITITVPRCEPVVAAAPTPPPSPPAAVPTAAQPVEFTLDNASSAIARRQAAREVLTFHIGKSAAPDDLWKQARKYA